MTYDNYKFPLGALFCILRRRDRWSECRRTLISTTDATRRSSHNKPYHTGEDYVPPQILRSVNAKAVDQAPTSFKLRFYSTLPSTTENTLRISLGLLPKSEVVPDRVFNTRSVLDAYYGYPATARVDYEIEKSPNRMQIEFAQVVP